MKIELDIKSDASLRVLNSIKVVLNDKKADALLLSGGIDSSILAGLDPATPAITVGIENESSDLLYAQKVTERLNMPWHHVQVSRGQALRAVSDVMILINTYDLGIFNMAVEYLGFRYASSLGYQTIRTGDFADELFRGYSFLYTQSDEEHKNHLTDLYPHVRLPSSIIAQALGVKTDFPYLKLPTFDAALSVSKSDLVVDVETNHAGDIYEAERDENTSPTRTWSKLALRQAGLGMLPLDVVFRQKTHVEYGSGFKNLENEVADSITDKEVEDLKIEKRFFDKVHAGLYKMYKNLGLSPTFPKDNQYACSWCGGGVNTGRNHCSTCGGYPSNS